MFVYTACLEKKQAAFLQFDCGCHLVLFFSEIWMHFLGLIYPVSRPTLLKLHCPKLMCVRFFLKFCHRQFLFLMKLSSSELLFFERINFAVKFWTKNCFW